MARRPVAGSGTAPRPYVTHAFAPHAHEEYALGVIEHGVQRVRFQKGTQLYPPQTIALINPGDVHTGQAAVPEGWTYRMLYFPPEMLGTIWTGLGRTSALPYFSTPAVTDDALFARLRQAHAAFEDPATSVLEKTGQLSAVLAHLMERHADERAVLPSRGSSSAAYLVRDVLEARYAEALTLSDLAAQAGVHPVYLLRIFKATFGLPPHAYQNLLRVRQARRLLRAGEAPAAAALSVGLYDQSHLNRLFGRVFGISPGRYQVAFIQDRQERGA